MPPAYPVRLPFAPTTRWHGIITLVGFLPTAVPTARGDDPSSAASSSYVRVSPYGMARSASYTRRWNAVPRGVSERDVSRMPVVSSFFLTP